MRSTDHWALHYVVFLNFPVTSFFLGPNILFSNKDIQIPSKHNKIYYTLPLLDYMFRLLGVIIRSSSELIQNCLIPSALWDPVALTIVGAIVLWVHICYCSVYGYLCYYSLQHPIFKHPQPTFLLHCERPHFTPIQNIRQNYHVAMYGAIIGNCVQ